MIADYIRGPGPRAGHLGRLKSPHVSNLIFSIKLKNKTFTLVMALKGGPTPTLVMALTWHGGSNILYSPFLNTM